MDDKNDWEIPGSVTVWLGNLNSEAEFEAYLRENIDEDADIDAPLNQFAEDIGFGFYDHDRQEAEYFGENLQIDKLIEPFSNSASFASEFAKAATSKGITTADSAILLFDCQYRQNISAAAPMTFIGNFDYE